MAEQGEKLLNRAYEKVWRRIGGRPWSYPIKESWHNYTILWLLGSCLIGILLGHLFWSFADKEEYRKKKERK